MVLSDVSLRLTTISVVLSIVSVVLALGSSLAACLCAGVVLGVLLAPWVRRASTWLTDYLQ